MVNSSSTAINATICVPADAPKDVREGRPPASEAAGVRLLRVEGDAAVFSVGSGEYTFLSS